MTNKKNKEISIKCGCGCNTYFEISQWDDEIYIAMVTAHGKENLFYRIVQAVKHIWGRDLVSHDLIFRKSQIKKLKKFISKM